MTDIVGSDQTLEWEDQIRKNRERIKFPVTISNDPDLDLDPNFDEPKIEIVNKKKVNPDKNSAKVVDIGSNKKTNKRKLF